MLKIKDWVARFEARREKDRPRKSMEWISLPCDLSSTGYGALMSTPAGAQHLGVFVALLELVAALPIAARNGSLVSPQAEPLTLNAISIKTRIPLSVLSPSIAALKVCGWLQDDDAFQELPGNSRSLLENPGGQGQGQGQGQGEALKPCSTPNGIERVTTSPKTASTKEQLGAQQESWFNEWWSIYWRHVAKTPARRAFAKHVKTPERFEAVIAATRAQSSDMLSRSPDKRPHGATWLNAERWLDEVEQVRAGQQAKQTALDEAMGQLFRKES